MKHHYFGEKLEIMQINYSKIIVHDGLEAIEVVKVKVNGEVSAL
jgi:hypothetical protein